MQDKNCLIANILAFFGYKDKNGWYVRAIYGLLVATIGGLAVRTGHFLPVWAYITFIIGNTLIGYSVSRLRLPVLITDILISAGFGSILLWLNT